MKTTALIMAGGRGERFWPRSRKNLPKQFLSMTDDGKTMIQLTVERIRTLVELEDVYVATNADYKDLVLEQLSGLPEQNILCEPVGRNTAPCIGLGAVHIAKKYRDAVMLVLPSDHLVKCNEAFADTLREAVSVAEAGERLVTVGITPNYPETGYGYIKYNKELRQGEAYAVERFVEKPDRGTAKQYLSEGTYLWNSGMFVWRISTILKNFEKYLPETLAGLETIGAAVGTAQEDAVLHEVFPRLASESIDYGIMEKAENIFILPGDFGWDDVGSWLAVGRIRKTDGQNNAVAGNVISVDSRNCVIQGGEKLIAAVGLEDMIVVDTRDATLICAKDSAGDIKKVLEILRDTGRGEYL